MGAIVSAEVAMGTLDPAIEREAWRVWFRAVELGDYMSLIFAVPGIAILARLAGDRAELQRVLDVTPEGNLPGVADHAAALSSVQGDPTNAAEVMMRARTAALAHGSSLGMSTVERRDGWLRFGANDPVGADEHAHRALIAAAAGPWPVELIGVFELLATVDAAQGWDVEAARLLGAAAAARAATGVIAVLEPEASSIEAARVDASYPTRRRGVRSRDSRPVPPSISTKRPVTHNALAASATVRSSAGQR